MSALLSNKADISIYGAGCAGGAGGFANWRGGPQLVANVAHIAANISIFNRFVFIAQCFKL